MLVPETYYDFVMDYAPYVYVVPRVGPDLTWGKAAFAAGFAVDFLYEAYFADQFDDRSAEIEGKVVELADWMLTQQITDNEKQAYGGFKSTETSTACYSVDVCRTVPALLKTYELTSNNGYLTSAKLAASTFLYNMQHKPSELAIHDRYYGGFARAVDTSDTWMRQMDVESLYGLIALRMLCDTDSANQVKYQGMIEDAVNFYRPGIEGLSLLFDPLPSGDGKWHRTGLNDDIIFDDSLAYGLLGLYDYEVYSNTVQKAYESVNAVGPSPLYPAYNPAICWAGYINILAKTVACDYYDAVAAGILSKIRKNHDKPAYEFSAKITNDHSDKFMFWGAKHADYAYVENKQSMATVCWLGQLFLGYETPVTRFTQVLNSKGENLTLYPITRSGENTAYGESIDLKAIVLPIKSEEIQIEPGYLLNDYLTLHLLAAVRRHDKITRYGLDYEVITLQDFTFKGEIILRKATCRRLHN